MTKIRPTNKISSNVSPNSTKSETYPTIGKQLKNTTCSFLKGLSRMQANPEALKDPQFLAEMKEIIIDLDVSSSAAKGV